MARTYVGWNEGLSKLNTSKGKGKTNKENEKKTAQKKKFLKCRVCGGTMIYVPNSNIFICENEVEKKKTIVNEDGTSSEKVYTERCGNVNLVDRQYMGYINYLFN